MLPSSPLSESRLRQLTPHFASAASSLLGRARRLVPTVSFPSTVKAASCLRQGSAPTSRIEYRACHVAGLVGQQP